MAERAEDKEDAIPYHYEDLPEGAIRLLQIPEQAIDQPWLLNAYELGECPTYVCLSYTWGPPVDTEECKADYKDAKRSLNLRTGNRTGRLSTQLNLWEGLEQLIAAGRNGLLWVDAICIRQDDIQERSSQVAIMGQIFANSEEVIVWLGKDQSNLEDFSWFHETFLPAAEKHFSDKGGISNLMQTVQTANLGIDPSSRWQGYVLFYEQHRWFHRCWILQEVALAQAVTVFCGPASLNFEDICDLSWLLHDLGAAIVTVGWKPEGIRTELIMGHKGHQIAKLRAVCQMAELQDDSKLYSVTGAGTPLQRCFAFLLSMLSAVREYQATNPRDKVYAALGMATKFLPPDTETILLPDYSLSTIEVYQNTTLFLIQKLPFLALLSFVEDRSLRLISDLPSWVPDFSTHSVNTTYRSRYEAYPHNACPSERGTYPRSIAGSTLKLYGGYFDTVSSVVEAMSNYRVDAQRLGKSLTAHNLELCCRMLDFLSCLEGKYINGQSRLEAFARTLILNQLDRGPPPSDPCQLFRGWLLSVLALCGWMSQRMDEAHALLQACTKSLQDLDEVQDRTLPDEESILLYAQLTYSNDITVLERAPSDASPEEASQDDEDQGDDKVWIDYNLYDRGLNLGLFLRQRLYKTSRGYIGLGPPSMQSGDQVCFICDATVPFVLRPEMDAHQYILIGETYLHGFMNGEVLQTDLKDRIGPLYLV